MPYVKKTLLTTGACDAGHDKRLSICLAADGFSFAVLSSQSELLSFGEAVGGHPSSMTDATRDIKSFFNEIGIRPLGFRKMELVVVSNESVWVPDEVYSPAANRQYLQLVGGKGSSAIAVHSTALASMSVFAADEGLTTAFKVALPGLVVVNQHIKMASSVAVHAGHPVLIGYWREGYVDLAAFNEGKYVYGNSLSFTDENALNYQLVELVRTFGLDGSETELIMCGNVDRDRFARLRPFFPKTSLFTGTCTIGQEFRLLRTYRYPMLFI